jgi:hypothetical protein
MPYWKRITDVSSYVKKMEDIWRNHYNIYFYQILPYPPNELKNNNKNLDLI